MNAKERRSKSEAIAKNKVVGYLKFEMSNQNDWGGDWGSRFENYDIYDELSKAFPNAEWLAEVEESVNYNEFLDWDILPKEAKDLLETKGFSEYEIKDEYIRAEAESIFEECEDYTFVTKDLEGFDFEAFVEWIENGFEGSIDEFIVLKEVKDYAKENNVSEELFNEWLDAYSDEWLGYYGYDASEDAEMNKDLLDRFVEKKTRKERYLKHLIEKEARYSPYLRNMDDEEVDPKEVEAKTIARVMQLVNRTLTEEELPAILSEIYNCEGEYIWCEHGNDEVIKEILDDCGLLKE